MKKQLAAHAAIFNLKDQINEILDNWLVEDGVSDEIGALITQWSKEVVGFDNVLSNAMGMLDTKQVTQAEIRDWATLNGYAFVKCASITDRLKVEKVAREIWGGEADKYFIE